MNSNKRIFGLDILRALAILLVVFSHGNILLTHYFPALDYFYGGVWGVEIFFVLSGFLIGKIFIQLFEQENYSVLDFWKRRWMRTLPNYYLVLFLNVIVFYLINNQLPAFGKHVLFVQNLFVRDWIFFGEAWSLSVEEWFYLLLPLTVVTMSFLVKNKRRVLIFTISVFILGSIMMRIHRAGYAENDVIAIEKLIRGVVICRLDALMLGVMMAYINIYFPSQWQAYSKQALGMAVVVLAGMLFITYTQPIGWFTKTFYFTGYGIGFALLLPALSQVYDGPRMLEKPITFISKISYSLYLLHDSLLLVNIHRYFHSDTNLTLTVFLYVIYLVLAITLSYLLYTYYEMPIMALRDRKERSVKA